MSDFMTSKHADTLNALDEMQQSVAYAVRRSVLADAERIIVRQEETIAELLAALEEIVSRNEIQQWFNLDQARAAIAKARGTP